MGHALKSLLQHLRTTATVVASALVLNCHAAEVTGTKRASVVDWSKLRNPVMTATNNLRDPSVLKTDAGYHIFYSRFNALQSQWGDPNHWTIAAMFTRDFQTYENDHDVSPKGFASPGDVIFWRGRWLLPYQSYPVHPSRLCFSESSDLKEWSPPRFFLDAARHLPWNGQGRLIDPSFVVIGDTLHCFFVGSAFRTNAGGQTIRGNLIGHAITRDANLREWQILSTNAPLIGFSERAPDGVENTMIFKTGDRWTMIFSEGLANQHLALATSSDLMDWKIVGPLELPRQRWNARKYGAPFVWREPGEWRMILMGTDKDERTTFGLLTSPDGVKWAMLPERERK